MRSPARATPSATALRSSRSRRPRRYCRFDILANDAAPSVCEDARVLTVREGFFDELVDADGQPRPHARTLVEALERARPRGADAGRPPPRRDLHAAGDHVRRRRAGRRRPGPRPAVPARPRAADHPGRRVDDDQARPRAAHPRAQRLRRRRLPRARDRPRRHGAVGAGRLARRRFARAAHGIRPPGGVYCHVAGCDLVRDADGSWKVLEDNVRTPSGISYVLENRVAMTRLLPGAVRALPRAAGRPLPGAAARRAARRSRRPAGRRRRRSSSGRPGPYNSAYFEHAFLARQMGVELVEASDLVVRDAVCYMRTTRGLQRVHAIYRRIDDDFIDPLEFRPDSRARRARADARLPRRHRRDRQRRRHRRRRRQGDLPLRAGDDPLLPRRGADARQRPDVPAGRPRRSASACSRGSTSSSSSRPSESGGKGVFIGPSATERASSRRQADEISAHAGALDRAGARAALDGADRRARRRAARRATSTCARSPSSARTSGSSPAASRASRCARAR